MTTRYSDAQAIKMWLERQRSPLTRDCYRRDVGRLQKHSEKPLNRVNLADLQKFAQALLDQGLAPISRARTIAAVRSLFGFCQRIQHIKSNPTLELPLPRYELKRAERLLSEGGLQSLLSVECSPRDCILLNLLYFAGLRVSEACGLKWRNLQFRSDTCQATVFGKGGQTRSVALPPELGRSLASLRGTARSDEPVFRSKSGRHLDRGRVRAIVRDVARRAGLDSPVSPHWLRHAHASHALDHGAPIHLVQATLGHRSIATTSAYLHAQPGDSSARFLQRESFEIELSRLALFVPATRVMNVLTAADAAEGEKAMPKKLKEQTITRTASGSTQKTTHKATRKAKAAPQSPRVAAATAKANQKASAAEDAPKAPMVQPDAIPETDAPKAPTVQPAAKGARGGSKTSRVIELLKREGGVTLTELMTELGWQSHTTRALMSAGGALTKKHGLTVVSAKGENGQRVYSIKA